METSFSLCSLEKHAESILIGICCQPPRANKKQKPIILVGKGVTFDARTPTEYKSFLDRFYRESPKLTDAEKKLSREFYTWFQTKFQIEVGSLYRRRYSRSLGIRKGADLTKFGLKFVKYIEDSRKTFIC